MFNYVKKTRKLFWDCTRQMGQHPVSSMALWLQAAQAHKCPQGTKTCVFARTKQTSQVPKRTCLGGRASSARTVNKGTVTVTVAGRWVLVVVLILELCLEDEPSRSGELLREDGWLEQVERSSISFFSLPYYSSFRIWRCKTSPFPASWLVLFRWP